MTDGLKKGLVIGGAVLGGVILGGAGTILVQRLRNRKQTPKKDAKTEPKAAKPEVKVDSPALQASTQAE